VFFFLSCYFRVYKFALDFASPIIPSSCIICTYDLEHRDGTLINADASQIHADL